MNRFYKISLVILVILSAINMYAIDWKKGFLHEENTQFLLAFSAGILGIILILILNIWSKINTTKK